MSGASNSATHWSGASDLIIQGISGGNAGQRFTFKNTGAKWAWFTHASGAAAASDRLTLLITSGLTLVAPGGSLQLQHDGTNWKLLTHDQGAWFDVAYNASLFTAQAGTWTVTAGQMVTYAYFQRGREISIKVKILSSTTSASPNYLDIELPFPCARSEYTNLCWGADGPAGAYIVLFPEFDTGHSTKLRLYKFNGTAWVGPFAGNHCSINHNYLTS